MFRNPLVTLLTIIFTLSLMLRPSFAQALGEINDRRLATFINNLHNNIVAPDGKICLYGYDGVIATLQEVVSSKVIIIDDTKSVAAKKCNIAYIGRNKEKYMSNSISNFSASGVATVGYLDNFIEKGGVFFLQEGRRGSVEIVLNHKMVKKLGIKLNPLIFNVVNN